MWAFSYLRERIAANRGPNFATPVDAAPATVMMQVGTVADIPLHRSFQSTIARAAGELIGPAMPTRALETEVCMADEKPKPNFSNVQSGGSSTAPSPPSDPA